MGFEFLKGEIFILEFPTAKDSPMFYFSKTFILLFMLLDQISSCFHLSRINKDNFLAVKKNIRFNHESKNHSPTHLLSTLPK